MMQIGCFLLLHFVFAFSVPIVDPGLFVITGVSSCRSGSGYCLLGLDCTLDEDFIHDNEGGHCKGLRSAFTPSAHFVCCRYSKEEFDNSSITVEDISTAPIEFTTQANYIDYATDHQNNTDLMEDNIMSKANLNNTDVINKTQIESNVTLYKTKVTTIKNTIDQINSTMPSLMNGIKNVSLVNVSNSNKYVDIMRRVNDDKVMQNHKNNYTNHDMETKTTNFPGSTSHNTFEETLSKLGAIRHDTVNPYKNQSNDRLSLESLQSDSFTHTSKKENREKIKPDPLAFLKRNFTLMDFKSSPQIHPCWMVHFLDSRTSDRLCVGGRVTSDLIITTAECAISLYVSGMENILILGMDEEYEENEEIYSISIHEEYKNNEQQDSENNIAMVKLSTRNSISQQCLLSLAEPRQKFLRKTCRTVISDSTDFYMERSQYCNGVVESQSARLSIHCPKMTNDEMRIIEGSPLVCGNVFAGLATNSSQKFINFVPISSYVTWILKYS